jgi:hypothetical protein
VLALLFGVADRELVLQLSPVSDDEAHGLSRLDGELCRAVAHRIRGLHSDRAGHPARFAGLTSACRNMPVFRVRFAALIVAMAGFAVHLGLRRFVHRR